MAQGVDTNFSHLSLTERQSQQETKLQIDKSHEPSQSGGAENETEQGDKGSTKNKTTTKTKQIKQQQQQNKQANKQTNLLGQASKQGQALLGRYSTVTKSSRNTPSTGETCSTTSSTLKRPSVQQSPPLRR